MYELSIIDKTFISFLIILIDKVNAMADGKSAEFLCIGDYICLYSEDTDGFIYCLTTRYESNIHLNQTYNNDFINY